MSRQVEQIAAFGFSGVLVTILLLPTLLDIDISPTQSAWLRLGLALAACGAAATIPVFFHAGRSKFIRSIVGLVATNAELQIKAAPVGVSQSVALRKDNPQFQQTIRRSNVHSSKIATVGLESDERSSLHQVLPDERTEQEQARRAATLLRVEIALQTVQGSKGDDGLHIELVKGNSSVGSGMTFVGPQLDKRDSRQSASIMMIPPAVYERAWTLRIHPCSCATGWAFRVEQVKGYFADGSVCVLHGASAAIRFPAGTKKDAVLLLQRS